MQLPGSCHNYLPMQHDAFTFANIRIRFVCPFSSHTSYNPSLSLNTVSIVLMYGINESTPTSCIQRARCSLCRSEISVHGICRSKVKRDVGMESCVSESQKVKESMYRIHDCMGVWALWLSTDLKKETQLTWTGSLGPCGDNQRTARSRQTWPQGSPASPSLWKSNNGC